MLETIIARMGAAKEKPAIISDDTRISYAGLLSRLATLQARFAAAGITPGTSVLLKGDFSGDGVAALLALWQLRAIVTPVAPTSFEKIDAFARISDAAHIVDAHADDLVITAGPGQSEAALFARLRRSGQAGLVIFTSGTTGVSKGAVHDLSRLLQKFSERGKDLVTFGFLLFDHIAGIDTLLYVLSNSSTLVVSADRSPDAVAALIARNRVEVLPTAPSFLNLLLVSGATERHDLSCLKIVTYGAETMPQTLLDRLTRAFPKAKLIQKYGTSEMGALRTRSEGGGSLWLDLGRHGYDWRLRDGLLELPTDTAMLGYLNAPSPFTEDGWYRTGDRIELRADGLMRILGRESDVINVGGQKVLPAEIENALVSIDEVLEAAVHGRPHPILGAAVSARVRVREQSQEPGATRARIRRALMGKLEAYKIPQHIELTSEALTTARFKQRRNAANS